MNNVKNKLSQINNYIINKGIPLPFISDDGKPSVSLTLLMISFVIWCLGITDVLKDIDLDKGENMMMVCAGLYFSRKVSKGLISVGDNVPTNKQGEPASAATNERQEK